MAYFEVKRRAFISPRGVFAEAGSWSGGEGKDFAFEKFSEYTGKPHFRALYACRSERHNTSYSVQVNIHTRKHGGGGGGSSWRHEVNAGAQSLRRQLTRTSMLKLILRVSFARQECDPELKAGEPLLQDVILYGRELTQDDDLDEHEKEKITRDMTQLLEHYDHLRNFIDDEQERFVIYIIIYIRQFNSDLFLFLVVPRKSATQRGSDAIIPSILPPG